MQDPKRRGVAGFFLFIAASFVGLALVGPGTALGASAHVFDPVLSLTGDCTASSLDTVEDPGCPALHPASPFAVPSSVAIDSYGDIFVANTSGVAQEGPIDVFSPAGIFITELPEIKAALSVAVDSDGNLYVFSAQEGNERILRFAPTSYEPKAGKLLYPVSPGVVAEHVFGPVAIAINPANNHLFANSGDRVDEYSSAEEGNKLLPNPIGKGLLSNSNGMGIAIDAAHNRIYASDRPSPTSFVIRVFELESPHALVRTVDGSNTPTGAFLGNVLPVAADEKTGHFFVYDGETAKAVYEFTEGGEYVSTIARSFKYVYLSTIAVDNGPFSPNGGENTFGHYLFVPSNPIGTGHVYAFGPAEEKEPTVESVSFSEVTEKDAELHAKINPFGLETHYKFEITTKSQSEEEGFAGAQTAGEGDLPVGIGGVEVSAPARELAPETSYVFRVVATNGLGADEASDEFVTYPETKPSPPCPNDAFRIGSSKQLPDCRAYELVTPPDTNGRSPEGVDHLGVYFPTREASPKGDKVSFVVSGGVIPGNEGTGSYGGDPYLSTRGPAGWSTAETGPAGGETPSLLPGSTSPDQGYSFWETAGVEGSAAIEGKQSSYVRYPDGHSALIGRGSVETDVNANGKLISENGSHVIFMSSHRLEEEAPPGETRAIYDRTPDEVTHVVSLLPGGLSPAEGENAFYEGASLDGKGVVFKLGAVLPTSPLYLRYNDEETYEVATGATAAGVAEGGNRAFYLKGGDLFRFDASTGETTAFTESGDVTVVSVSGDGSAAYFVSPSILTGKEENPNGAVAQPGKDNLYLSREGAISFVATLTEQDVVAGKGGFGLELWVPQVASYGEVAEDPSRTTPDGNVMLFESRADLAGYDPEGHVEVYRYDASAGELECVSCNPTRTPASGNASLLSFSVSKGEPQPFGPFAAVGNLRADGRRVFFQSEEALVPGDTDGLQDVYEWEANGVGSCERPDGCVYLVSSGNSKRADYLYAVSDSGDDVFFRTSDLLLPSDSEETPSIYDAKVGGGFAGQAEHQCEGEGCRPDLLAPPPLLTPAPYPEGEPEGPVAVQCPKGKHKVKRHGKVRCVKKKGHRHSAGRKGAAK